MGFAPKFWAPGEDLRRPFAAMWMEIGWALYFQVVGTHRHYMWSSKYFLPQVVGTLKSSIEMHSLPLLCVWSFLLFLLPVHSPSLPSLLLNPPKGGREQRGSRQVAWIESFSQIWGLFQGFGAFLGIQGLFGDSGPFWGFAAFSRICSLFTDSQPLCGFAAFSRIHGRGATGANEPPGETFATWYFNQVFEWFLKFKGWSFPMLDQRSCLWRENLRKSSKNKVTSLNVLARKMT